MELTPNDIRGYKFPNQMRGYDKDEVDNFVEQVASALEQAKQEILKLSMELESTKGQLTSLKQFEDTIKGAAIDARRNADNTIAAAKAEAEQILVRARAEGEKAMAARTEQIDLLENQMAKLEMTRKSYVTKLRGTIESHLEIIEEIISEEAVANAAAEMARQPRKSDIEVTASNEVDSKNRETVATQPSEEKGIKTEEANAPDPSVNTSVDHLEQIASAAAADASMDPEIVKALKQYQEDSSEVASKAQPSAPAPDSMVETTARAEDVPPEFVAAGQERSTGKVEINSSENEKAKAAPAKASPENLSAALDEVAAKFEEEMDKAADK